MSQRSIKTKLQRQRHQAKLPVEIHMPSPFADIVDELMVRDHQWFREHPGETEYRRAYVHGELYPLFFPWDMTVTVTEVRPGFRIRTGNRKPLNPEDAPNKVRRIPLGFLKRL